MDQVTRREKVRVQYATENSIPASRCFPGRAKQIVTVTRLGCGGMEWNGMELQPSSLTDRPTDRPTIHYSSTTRLYLAWQSLKFEKERKM